MSEATKERKELIPSAGYPRLRKGQKVKFWPDGHARKGRMPVGTIDGYCGSMFSTRDIYAVIGKFGRCSAHVGDMVILSDNTEPSR